MRQFGRARESRGAFIGRELKMFLRSERTPLRPGGSAHRKREPPAACAPDFGSRR